MPPGGATVIFKGWRAHAVIRPKFYAGILDKQMAFDLGRLHKYVRRGLVWRLGGRLTKRYCHETTSEGTEEMSQTFRSTRVGCSTSRLFRQTET